LFNQQRDRSYSTITCKKYELRVAREGNPQLLRETGVTTLGSVGFKNGKVVQKRRGDVTQPEMFGEVT